MKAPSEAVEYYGLDPEKAMMRDVLLAIRADEAIHRSINHHFSDIPQDYEVQSDKIKVSSQGFRIDEAQDVKMLDDKNADQNGKQEKIN